MAAGIFVGAALTSLEQQLRARRVILKAQLMSLAVELLLAGEKVNFLLAHLDCVIQECSLNHNMKPLIV